MPLLTSCLHSSGHKNTLKVWPFSPSLTFLALLFAMVNASASAAVAAEQEKKVLASLRASLANQVLLIEFRLRPDGGHGMTCAETQPGESVSFGTGFVISPKGHILTARHVFAAFNKDLDDACAWAHWVEPGLNGAQAKPMKEPLDVSTLYLSDANDAAVIKFATYQPKTYLTIDQRRLTGADLLQTEDFYFVGYDGPAGDVKTLDEKEGIKLQSLPIELSSNCLSERRSCDSKLAAVSGNSGSPIVTGGGKVVAVVIRDHPQDKSRGRIVHIGKLADFLNGANSIPATNTQLDEPTVLLKRIQGAPHGPIVRAHIWLDVVGTKTFVIDGIRIIHHRSNLVSGASGAFSADAHYKIEYEPNTDKIYPLDTILRLNPEHSQHRELFVRLDLKPNGVVSGASWVEVRMLFRSEDGTHSGELALLEPAAEHMLLARLTDSDVVLARDLELRNPDRGWLLKGGGVQVVSPKGAQRVVHESTTEALTWVRLMDGLTSYPMHVRDAVRSLHPAVESNVTISPSKERSRINARLTDLNRLPMLKQMAAQGDRQALELCVWLGSLCADLIYDARQLAKSGSDFTEAAVHHLLNPSDRILSLVVANPIVKERQLEKAQFFWIAQALAPTTGTIPALLDTLPMQPDALKSIFLLRHRLNADERRRAATFAGAMFKDEVKPAVWNKDLVLQVWLSTAESARTAAQTASAHLEKVRPKSGSPDYAYEGAVRSLECIAGTQLIADLADVALSGVSTFLGNCDLQMVWPTPAAAVDPNQITVIELASSEYGGAWQFACTVDKEGKSFKLIEPIATGPRTLMQRIESSGKLSDLLNIAWSDPRLSRTAIRLLAYASDAAWAQGQLAKRCNDSPRARDILDSLVLLHLRHPDEHLAREFTACGGVASRKADIGRVVQALWAAPNSMSAATLREIYRTASHDVGLASHLKSLVAHLMLDKAEAFGISRDSDEYKLFAAQTPPYQCQFAPEIVTQSAK